MAGPDLHDGGAAARDDAAARRRRWVLGAIGWDVGLPLAVALSPELLRALHVDRDLTDLTAGFAIPMIAAVVRASRAYGQIERGGHVRGHWWRQILLGIAVLVLMVFEVGMNLIILRHQNGNGPWIKADEIQLGIAYYVIYFVLILIALRPAPARA